MSIPGVADMSADAQLAKMGYKAELPRNLSMMSILGLYVFYITFDFVGQIVRYESFRLTDECCWYIGLSRLWVRSCPLQAGVLAL